MSSEIKDKVVAAALEHVAFDGWSEATYKAALEQSGVDRGTADVLFPRGAVDVAVAFHKAGDAEMVARLKRENLLVLRYSQRVAAGIRYRLEAVAAHKEAVRRGTTLFALPQYASDGAKLIWGTSDAIWSALGDRSDDHNWYTKRATLSGVYASTVLFWLGDNSEDHSATWDFLDRRIDNVMQFEKLKSQVRANPVASKLLIGPDWLLSKIRPPLQMPDADLPGMMMSGNRSPDS